MKEHEKENNYYFRLALLQEGEGIVQSEKSLEDAKEMFEEDLTEVYGEGYSLLEFRETSEEEIEGLSGKYQTENRVLN